ncbi:AAA family ATPase, partial [Rhodopseudomonas sp.]|uniref:AAA family ATPase n=1 Tax=Rhodopseudomonas sp. TaxID=1078 RepID=UPI003B3ACFCB
SAGRTSALEYFRSGNDSPGRGSTNPAAIGHMSYTSQWWEFEGVPGLYMRLKERADLLLKVQARLQVLQQRHLRLEWSQSGLQLKFISVSGDQPYYANTEASGLIQLIPLLAAIYDDEISILLVDEPEVSLHPQLQAFLLEELQSVAGRPTDDAKKKVVVIATHSASMVPLKQALDISNIVFFRDRKSLPIQVATDAGELKSRKLGALTSRLSENHKFAFFALSILLVEGPSDEIFMVGLSQALKHPLLMANTQIVPIIGKGEFVETIKFFRLMGKRVCIMADLDALTDDNAVVVSFRSEAADFIEQAGHNDLASFDQSLRSELSKLVNDDWESIHSTAESHRYWKNRNVTDDIAKRRAALAALLSTCEKTIHSYKESQRWLKLRKRYIALLEILDRTGCVFLRKGTIEDYFSETLAPIPKPEAAAIEVERLMTYEESQIISMYSDPVRSLRGAAPIPEINENYLLREQLGSLLGAALQIVAADMPDDELNARVAANSSTDQPLFRFENKTEVKNGSAVRRIKVSINSPAFFRSNFPFEISEGDNQAIAIRAQLP